MLSTNILIDTIVMDVNFLVSCQPFGQRKAMYSEHATSSSDDETCSGPLSTRESDLFSKNRFAFKKRNIMVTVVLMANIFPGAVLAAAYCCN